jgi:acyl transferase domain-containing protein
MKPSRIAIVGMAGRFPGARNVQQFWRNLRDGVESIRSLSDRELLAAGAAAEDLKRSDYVKRASTLDDVSMFDAAFFGMSPKDAAIMDPQHRHFLECAWEALEDAGHPPQRFNGSIGVFAGSGMNSYLIHNLLANRKLSESAGSFQLKQTGNDKDVLATRVSYQFDLRGPSINVQTACSTSLVAVHLACQSLLDFECDMALAGGVTIEIPHGQGYIYREGEILSRDGHCRAFDASSTGTVFGSGVGVVVLRRLEDAIADRDTIRALILGSAVNNDGARKVGYFAPSVEGQAEVIAEALEFAGVSADDISYVETHGTGTVIGDPIEVRALTQAFRKSTARIGYCALGSVKTNVGHLDTAAGVVGLIKTVLALEHAQLPPSLHFHDPNPHIQFQDSPFFVSAKLRDWPSKQQPRRAGVTSLGIGGTNAHVVLEEAPALSVSRQATPCELFTLSAKSESALERSFENLTAHLGAHPDMDLGDASFTCQLGRHSFPHRRAWVVDCNREAMVGNSEKKHGELFSGVAATPAPRIAFLFSGQGSQHINLGRELYEHAMVFRESMDICAEYLHEHLGIGLRDALYPPKADEGAARENLNQTWLTQPALFSIEYSLARWWISLGVEPTAMAGHSIGEYVAACIAGVFSLQDGLAIAAFRGRLMSDLPTGAMLAVSLPESAIHLGDSLSLAAINSPSQCVVSGPTHEIATLEQALTNDSVPCRRLITSHAFHSAMMEPILGAFEERLRSVSFQPPRIPYLSNLTGTWIKPEEATDPAYWSRHIRQTVRFSDCLTELLRNPNQILIEVGPGNTLTSLARQQGSTGVKAFQSLPRPQESIGALQFALQTVGQIWTLGANVDFAKLHSPESVQRIPLPTYPFERVHFWIHPDKSHAVLAPIAASAPPAGQGGPIAFYRRVWRPAPLTRKSPSEARCWMIFRDSLGLGDRIGSSLAKDGQHVILVDAGSSYNKSADGSYTVRPGVRSDYDALLMGAVKSGRVPDKVLHLWSVTPEGRRVSLREVEERSFLSPLFLAQALASQDIAGLDIALVSNHMQQVFAEPARNPARAVLLGPARVIPKELAGITCRSIDLDFTSKRADEFAELLLAEMNAGRDNDTVAFRDGGRFVETVEPLTLSDAAEDSRLERGGVYLITGGLGELGLAVAEQLARELKACLVLITRSTVTSESNWEAALHDASLSNADKDRIQRLVEIRSLAGGLTIAQGDVTNLEQMREAVALAIKRYGKIDGVFHAAGVLDDGPLMLKTAQGTVRVLDPKVRGTLVIEEALRNVPLRCFVLFSSISSIYPPPGQVDYAAANAFLDAFAASRKGPVTVVNWGAWRDVGMAARSAFSHPLLRERLLNTSHETVYGSEFSQQALWLLSEHKLQVGQALNALLPGTGYMEMAAAAFTRGSRQQAIEFHDVFFLAPLMLLSDETRDVRVQLKREQESDSPKGSFRFSVFSRAGDWVEHCTGIIAPCLSRPAAHADRAAIVARCGERKIVFDELNRTRQERHLVFGPRWQSLRRLFIGKGEALAEIELNERFSGDISTFHIHPSLLDLATGVAVYLTADYENSEDLFLPFSYRRMRVYRPLPAKLFSHIRAKQQDPHRSEVEIFDITLFDELGLTLAEIEGFSVRRIADPFKSLHESPRVHNNEHPREDALIEIPDRAGILAIDGVRALVRFLSGRSPRAVIAVAQPLDGLDQPIRVPSAQLAGAAALHTPLPEETVEGKLARWWRELLGVDQVGLDDDFFNLGGHSLIGVRLLAKIKRAYHVDLDFGILFEARTIRQLTNVILKSQQVSGGMQIRGA